MEAITGFMKQLCRLTGVDFDSARWQESVKRKFDSSLARIFVAETDVPPGETELMGMAFATIRKQASGFHFGWISNLIVDPEYRNIGVGEALVREAIDFFRRNHVESVRITVKSNSVEAQNLLYKLGFDEILRVMEYKI